MSSARRCRDVSGERSWRKAFASICRIRSRVTSNSWLDLFVAYALLATDAEPQPDNLLFFWRESLQDVGRFVANVGIDHRIDPVNYQAGFYQVAERRFPVGPTGVSSETGSREIVFSF